MTREMDCDEATAGATDEAGSLSHQFCKLRDGQRVDWRRRGDPEPVCNVASSFVQDCSAPSVALVIPYFVFSIHTSHVSGPIASSSKARPAIFNANLICP